ncbi:MAG: hypothetical protein RIS35_2009, partial [Pseudomonadota bacterium]
IYNDAPTLAAPIVDQAATEDTAFTFQIASGAFADVDAGNVFTYSATRADGSALPAWLAFTPAARTFSGNPANGDVGVVDVQVTATDSAGSTVTDAFSITVANVNDPVTGTVSITGTPTQGQVLTANDTLGDPDGLGALTYTWKADGTAFATGSTVTLGQAQVGMAITVTASFTDAFGGLERVDSDPTPPVATIASPGRNLTGDSLANTMLGDTGDDTIAGQGGNDTLTGAGGDDLLDGGDGIDWATFSGEVDAYTIERTGTLITVTDHTGGRDGTDSGTGLEKLQFANMSVNLTIQATAASIPMVTLDRIAELYVGFFGRVPAADGLENWIRQFVAGKTVFQIADDFYGIGSGPALRDYTGYWDSVNDRELTNTEYVTIVYRNVLGREGKAGGIGYWSSQLESGAETRGSLVCKMLDSAHTYAGDSTWGWVADLLDDKVTMSKNVAIDWGLNYGQTAQESISKGIAIASALDLSPNPDPAFADTAVKTFDFESAIALVGIDPTLIDLMA